MSFSQSAATNVIPLLARIVLAAAFIPAGWHKLMQEVTFEGENAATLRQLGIAGTTPPAGGSGTIQTTSSWTKSLTGGGWSLLATTVPPVAKPGDATPQGPKPPVAKPGDAKPADGLTADPKLGESAKPIADSSPEAVSPTAPGAPAMPPVVIVPTDASPLKAASMHHVTLMVHRAGWAYPTYQAYLATAAELIGGALILVGLFSRLWGLALASVMAVAFVMTTLPLFAGGSPFSVFFNLPIADFNRLFCQAGLFVLAFGVFLVGPGTLSIDRAIFRRPAPEE